MIAAGGDWTFPNNVGWHNRPRISISKKNKLLRIVNTAQIAALYVENIDEIINSAKVRVMPMGVRPGNSPPVLAWYMGLAMTDPDRRLQFSVLNTPGKNGWTPGQEKIVRYSKEDWAPFCALYMNVDIGELTLGAGVGARHSMQLQAIYPHQAQSDFITESVKQKETSTSWHNQSSFLPPSTYTLDYGLGKGAWLRSRQKRMVHKQHHAYLRSALFTVVENAKGDLEQNPIIWEAMLLGVIPIIKRSALTYIYEEEDLPVVVVDAWTPELINQQNLTRWRKRFSPYITDPEKRRATLEKLTLDYWWKKISDPLSKYPCCSGDRHKPLLIKAVLPLPWYASA